MINVQLIVVQGKPEGKTIPLTGPLFRIGRDETCHLRPSSVEVSRQHAEITITESAVTVRDLGSRTGTQVNSKTITVTVPLKSGDLVRIGQLTFAVSIQGTPHGGTSSRTSATSVETEPAEVESWLIADNDRPSDDRPDGVYNGDSETINAFREVSVSKLNAFRQVSVSKPGAVDAPASSTSAGPGTDSDAVHHPEVLASSGQDEGPDDGRGLPALATIDPPAVPGLDPLAELGRIVKDRLRTDHVCVPDAISVGLPDALRQKDSVTHQTLAEGYYRLVVIECSRGLSSTGSGDFEYDARFLPYLRDLLYGTFEIETNLDFHPEQIVQVLKDEPVSLFCFLDTGLIPYAYINRLRTFTQEAHRVLFCGQIASPPIKSQLRGSAPPESSSEAARAILQKMLERRRGRGVN